VAMSDHSNRGQPPRVRVSRVSAPWRDRLRDYEVILDGVLVAEVASGESTEFDCPAGAHTIRIKLDWGSSNPIEFSVGPGEALDFECEPGGSAWAAVFSLLRPSRYIRLRRVS
jgi:hypothetical protein